jgi:hypothetical protein
LRAFVDANGLLGSFWTGTFYAPPMNADKLLWATDERG